MPSDLNGAHHAVLPRSGPLVVLLSGTNKNDGEFDFWGYAQRASASCILLNNGQNRWYQDGVPGFGGSVSGTAELIREWASALRAPEIVCIGASMGGSAAVLYGTHVDARVLAFSFEAHLRHPGSRSAKYIPTDFPLPYPDLSPLIRQSKMPITSLFGGDDVIDVAESSRLMGTPNLVLTCLQGVDHALPRHLRTTGQLTPYLNNFVAGRTLPRLRNEDDDLATPEYAKCIATAYRSVLEKRGMDALVAARRAVQLRPFALVPRLLAGRALLLLKQPEASLQHLGVAASLDRTHESRLFLGRALRGLRRNIQAADFHAETLAIHPSAHSVLYDRALALWSATERDAARADLAKAIALAPKAAAYKSRLSTWDAIKA